MRPRIGEALVPPTGSMMIATRPEQQRQSPRHTAAIDAPDE